MSQKSLARGSATRTANMNKRREQILSCAGELIAKGGLDAFTLNKLAVAAEVTIPTIHNLIGKKSDIFERLVDEMIERVGQALFEQTVQEPIEAAQTFINKLLELYRSNEGLYKAAFVAGEQVKLFEHEKPQGVFAKSLSLSVQVCENAIKTGLLEGHIDSKQLAQELFGCQRLARGDWVNGYINLAEYKQQVLRGMYVVFAADATPSYKQKLLTEIRGC